MYFKNAIHQEKFLEWLNRRGGSNNAESAAAYLLASDSELWRIFKSQNYNVAPSLEIADNGLPSFKGSGTYTIVKVARDILQDTSESHIGVGDMSKRGILCDYFFDLIIQAVKISRNGVTI